MPGAACPGSGAGATSARTAARAERLAEFAATSSEYIAHEVVDAVVARDASGLFQFPPEVLSLMGFWEQANRPNPLGLHRVRVVELAGNRLEVGPIEAIDGTPVVDVKPVLPGAADS